MIKNESDLSTMPTAYESEKYLWIRNILDEPVKNVSKNLEKLRITKL